MSEVAALPSLDAFQALRAQPLFSSMSDEHLHMLAKGVRILEFSSGESVFVEGEAAHHFYILLEGEAAVLKRGAGGSNNHEVARLYSGAIFGELALFDRDKRSATIRASTPIRVLEISIVEMEILRQMRSGITGVLNTLGKDVVVRLKTSTATTAASLERALEEAETRIRMGYFIVSVMITFTLFTTFLGTAAAARQYFERSEFVTIPLLLATTVVLIIFVRVS